MLPGRICGACFLGLIFSTAQNGANRVSFLTGRSGKRNGSQGKNGIIGAAAL